MAGSSRDEPSPWVRRFLGLVGRGGEILDVACGRGRHTALCIGQGYRVTAVDRDVSQLGELAESDLVTAVEADLEAGPWPLAGRQFAGVVVTNYLWRPRFDELLALVGDSGVIVYETFALGQERIGRPRNPDFLLRSGELFERLSAQLRVLAYEHGMSQRGALVQRAVALRESPGATLPTLP